MTIMESDARGSDLPNERPPTSAAKGAPLRAAICGGNCALCGDPLPSSAGRGRPAEYCGAVCRELSSRISRLAYAARAASPSAVAGVRRRIVAEVLNRLPLDPEVLSARARQQPRDESGRFTADCPAANYLSLDLDERRDCE